MDLSFGNLSRRVSIINTISDRDDIFLYDVLLMNKLKNTKKQKPKELRFYGWPMVFCNPTTDNKHPDTEKKIFK